MIKQNLKKSKRGLSDVVTTVLIVLIALAAVAIVWGFIQPSLRSDASQITSGCITLELIPQSCSYVSNGEAENPTYNSIVRIGRGTDQITLSEVKVIFELGDRSEVRTSSSVPESLGSTSLTFANFSKQPVEISVAGLIKTESNSEKLCPQSSAKVECVSG